MTLRQSVHLEPFPGQDAAYAQVGWLGQTGGVYGLDEHPSDSEPGGFTPLYIQIGRYVTDGDGRRYLED